MTVLRDRHGHDHGDTVTVTRALAGPGRDVDLPVSGRTAASLHSATSDWQEMMPVRQPESRPAGGRLG